MEPAIENMTINKYLEYEAEKERLGAEKLKPIGQGKLQNGCDDDTSKDTNNANASICEQEVDNINDLEKKEA
nr:hypothetical protein [Tanacetum cinerariifolium]